MDEVQEVAEDLEVEDGPMEVVDQGDQVAEALVVLVVEVAVDGVHMVVAEALEALVVEEQRGLVEVALAVLEVVVMVDLVEEDVCGGSFQILQDYDEGIGKMEGN